MKKIVISLLLVVLCLSTVGCGKKEKSVILLDGWDIDLSAKELEMPQEAKDAFTRANKKKYKLVSLLATQVVEGTNYMFLVKDDVSYKIVVVYNDLNNKSTMTKISNFEFRKYVNENIEANSEELDGAWNVYIPEERYLQGEKVQQIFDDATMLIETTYSPIALIGTQIVSGTNYAILAYSGLTEEEAKIYLVTVYEDLEGTRQIVSSAYVDLSEYN